MFSIGGVTALKNHDFFCGLDWIALGQLEIAPPIDLRKTDYSSSTTTGKSSAKKEIPEQRDCGADDARMDEIDDFVASLKYFDAEFTNQVLSRSIVEDTLTPGTTGVHTPVVETPFVDGEQEELDDAFRDFEYTDESVTYSQQQIEEFEELFKSKQQKAAKKKLLKQKKDEERSRLEEIRRKEQEATQKKREEEETEKKRKDEVERREKERERLLKQLLQEKTQLTAERQATDDALVAQQKKVKALRKKLRDIQDLKERQQKEKLDKDQLLKLSKEGELVKEMAELVVEEERLSEASAAVQRQFSAFLEREEQSLRPFKTENGSVQEPPFSTTTAELARPAAPAPTPAPAPAAAPPSPLPPSRKAWSTAVGGPAASSAVPVAPVPAPVPVPASSASEKVDVPKEKKNKEDSWETVPVSRKNTGSSGKGARK
jgi:hypothetical protein